MLPTDTGSGVRILTEPRAYRVSVTCSARNLETRVRKALTPARLLRLYGLQIDVDRRRTGSRADTRIPARLSCRSTANPPTGGRGRNVPQVVRLFNAPNKKANYPPRSHSRSDKPVTGYLRTATTIPP
jgi:hypothetical protein